MAYKTGNSASLSGLTMGEHTLTAILQSLKPQEISL